jgi:hypothetical protein
MYETVNKLLMILKSDFEYLSVIELVYLTLILVLVSETKRRCIFLGGVSSSPD